jgi:hypothetical protein
MVELAIWLAAAIFVGIVGFYGLMLVLVAGAQLVSLLLWAFVFVLAALAEVFSLVVLAPIGWVIRWSRAAS